MIIHLPILYKSTIKGQYKLGIGQYKLGIDQYKLVNNKLKLGIGQYKSTINWST